MKNISILTFWVLLVGSPAFAQFSIDAVEEIRCTDPSKSKDLNVELWTKGPGADAYVRKSGSIPYAYVNARNSMGSFQAGTFSVKSSDATTGQISLVDGETSLLELLPTGNDSQYTALLTGGVDIRGDWQEISQYPLLCTLTFSN